MNKLMPYEKKWVAQRLKMYRIQYAEIYNEVYDHLLSACEDKRTKGDTRDILSLFQETMDQDIGSHAGIAQMTSEREYTLKTVLKTSLVAEFKSYFISQKLIIPFSIACLVYCLATILEMNPNWLVVASLGLSCLPWAYLLGIATKNGYLRTIRSRRKTSLVNHLMFKLSNPIVIGLYFGLFGMPALTSLFPLGLSSSITVKNLILFLGHPGFSLVIAGLTAYAFAFIKVVKTDYRQLIRELA